MKPSLAMMTITLLESARPALALRLELAILLGSLAVVLIRKVIYCALLLGLVFVCVALLYLLLNADFLAAAQVLIYVGAVNVLIVFAVMLVDKPEVDSTLFWTTGDAISALTFTMLFVLLIAMISVTPWNAGSALSAQAEPGTTPFISSVQVIGLHLLTDLLLPFELLSILLLIALVGAVIIARQDNAID